MRGPGIMLLLAATGCAVAPDGQQPAPDEPASPEVAGNLSLRYRGRERGGLTDQDLFAVVSLHAGEVARDGWRASLLGRAARDLDGGAGFFGGLSDAEGGRTDADLYHAWVDLDAGQDLAPVRLGRQLLVETPELAWFDGVRASTLPAGRRGWAFGAYAGVPVHLFSGSSGDLAAGAWVEGAPWPGGRARLDVMRLEDEVTLGAREDDLLGLDLRHAAGPALHLDGRASWLEGEARDARAAVNWFPDGWTVRLQHYALFDPQRERALEADPFFDALRTLFPYTQSQAVVVRDLERALLELGGDLRRVDDAADVGEFNRDFERGWASVTLLDALPEDLQLTLSADRWTGDAARTEGLGFDLRKSMGESEASLGTLRSLYKYDLFLDTERVDVRTWYLRWRRRPSQGPGLDVRYEFERTDSEDVHGAALVLTWRF